MIENIADADRTDQEVVPWADDEIASEMFLKLDVRDRLLTRGQPGAEVGQCV